MTKGPTAPRSSFLRSILVAATLFELLGFEPPKCDEPSLLAW